MPSTDNSIHLENLTLGGEAKENKENSVATQCQRLFDKDPTVHFFSINDCTMALADFEKLAWAMIQHGGLRELNFANIQFTDKPDPGAIGAIIRNILCANPLLENLRCCGFTHQNTRIFADQDVLSLAPAIAHAKFLVNLELATNNITNKGLLRLSTTLKYRPLHRLCLADNTFSANGVSFLLDALLAQQTIIELDLSKNAISGLITTKLAGFLKATTTLEYLNLGDTHITDSLDDLNKILQAIAQNKSLQDLFIKDELIKPIAKIRADQWRKNAKKKPLKKNTVKADNQKSERVVTEAVTDIRKLSLTDAYFFSQEYKKQNIAIATVIKRTASKTRIPPSLENKFNENYVIYLDALQHPQKIPAILENIEIMRFLSGQQLVRLIEKLTDPILIKKIVQQIIEKLPGKLTEKHQAFIATFLAKFSEQKTETKMDAPPEEKSFFTGNTTINFHTLSKAQLCKALSHYAVALRLLLDPKLTVKLDTELIFTIAHNHPILGIYILATESLAAKLTIQQIAQLGYYHTTLAQLIIDKKYLYARFNKDEHLLWNIVDQKPALAQELIERHLVHYLPYQQLTWDMARKLFDQNPEFFTVIGLVQTCIKYSDIAYQVCAEPEFEKYKKFIRPADLALMVKNNPYIAELFPQSSDNPTETKTEEKNEDALASAPAASSTCTTFTYTPNRNMIRYPFFPIKDHDLLFDGAICAGVVCDFLRHFSDDKALHPQSYEEVFERFKAGNPADIDRLIYFQAMQDDLLKPAKTVGSYTFAKGEQSSDALLKMAQEVIKQALQQPHLVLDLLDHLLCLRYDKQYNIITVCDPYHSIAYHNINDSDVPKILVERIMHANIRENLTINLFIFTAKDLAPPALAVAAIPLPKPEFKEAKHPVSYDNLIHRTIATEISNLAKKKLFLDHYYQALNLLKLEKRSKQHEGLAYAIILYLSFDPTTIEPYYTTLLANLYYHQFHWAIAEHSTLAMARGVFLYLLPLGSHLPNLTIIFHLIENNLNALLEPLTLAERQKFLKETITHYKKLESLILANLEKKPTTADFSEEINFFVLLAKLHHANNDSISAQKVLNKAVEIFSKKSDHIKLDKIYSLLTLFTPAAKKPSPLLAADSPISVGTAASSSLEQKVFLDATPPTAAASKLGLRS